MSLDTVGELYYGETFKTLRLTKLGQKFLTLDKCEGNSHGSSAPLMRGLLKYLMESFPSKSCPKLTGSNKHAGVEFFTLEKVIPNLQNGRQRRPGHGLGLKFLPLLVG